MNEIKEMVTLDVCTEMLDGEKFVWSDELGRITDFDSEEQCTFYYDIFIEFAGKMYEIVLNFNNMKSLDSVIHKNIIRYYQDGIEQFIKYARKMYLFPDVYYEKCKYVFERDITFYEVFKVSILIHDVYRRYDMLIYGKVEKQKTVERIQKFDEKIKERMDNPSMFKSH